MKYLMLVGDGMADEPCPDLEGKTPLQYAHTPNMDYIASQGELGLVQTVPAGYPPGSDVANLSVMGYNPKQYYTGRAPIEAVSMGLSLDQDDVAFRCNLVTLAAAKDYQQAKMADYCAGEISSAEARELIEHLNQELGGNGLRFNPGISYRHLMVWSKGPDSTRLTPPHDIYGQVIGEHLPSGKGSEVLGEIMQQSYRLLSEHPVNRKRRESGLNEANSVWFWGQGRKPALPLFADCFGLQGAVISAVDLIKGIGLCAGMESIDVEGATGNSHTNYRGKAVAGLQALAEGRDFVLIHVEAPDEASHQGELQTKIKSIEDIDRLVLGEVLHGLRDMGAFRVALLPDHPTPVRTRTHTGDPVPFAILREGQGDQNKTLAFDEEHAASTGITIPLGHELMERFIRR